jgi:type IV pilus assembly protein PilM
MRGGAVRDRRPDTTSLKVLRDDDLIYDRDQAFGGSQLTQLMVASVRLHARRGGAPRSAPASCLTTTTRWCWQPFVESPVAGNRRALQYFFTSTPHHRVDYILLAGGTAGCPA